MRRGEPKVITEELKRRAEKRHESIVAKCHPAIFDLAQLWKEHIEALKALGQNPPRELTAELEARTDKRLSAIHQKYSGPAPPPPNTFAAQTIFSDAALQEGAPPELGFLEDLHFQRHGVPLKLDLERAEARDGEAARRLQRTERDYEELRCDHRPIPPFKGNLEHSNIFQLLWGFGAEKLTPEELADFFDSYCPCACAHDPDALKKLRARFQKALARTVMQT
jgi:hypothetical protein